jgi:hypothetical protein
MTGAAARRRRKLLQLDQSPSPRDHPRNPRPGADKRLNAPSHTLLAPLITCESEKGRSKEGQSKAQRMDGAKEARTLLRRCHRKQQQRSGGEEQEDETATTTAVAQEGGARRCAGSSPSGGERARTHALLR